MPTNPQMAAEIAKGLTAAQRDALKPFAFFPYSIGVKMIDLGLFTQVDGVWVHTPLGLAVRRSIEEQTK